MPNSAMRTEKSGRSAHPFPVQQELRPMSAVLRRPRVTAVTITAAADEVITGAQISERVLGRHRSAVNTAPIVAAAIEIASPALTEQRLPTVTSAVRWLRSADAIRSVAAKSLEGYVVSADKLRVE